MNAMGALVRCRRAWEATQPQLFWTDENLFGGLDEPGPGAARLVEPAYAGRSPDGRRARPSETIRRGRGANHIQGARRGQKGA